MSKKYSILVIDDEIEILDMLSRFLNRNPDFSVQTFSNPVSALSSINSSTKYDLVLLDIMMPQMNGLDVLEKLKEINSDQKVIMMTAYLTLDKVLKSHKIGATNYVMKPFSSLDSLEKKVIEVLEA
ncbi:response regulator [Aliarcobacter cryaerophilus]|uniref:Response regulator n=1 Tax=Aliarcobacter cryaerophilus TaxID=28198 RepID=A0A2S9TEF6_9BACT|nr:response regulator [Aliarcobacter cryaerophilus]PRM97203.1 response regulator [Arcobacter cryaerophilus gv. crypticus]